MDTTKDKLIRLLERRVFNADDLADQIDDLYKQDQALQLLQPDVIRQSEQSFCCVCGNQYKNPNNDSDTCYECREPHAK